MADVKRIVEAILFSSSEALTPSKLAGVLDGVDGRKVRAVIAQLNEEYEREGRAFRIEEIAGGFQMLTRSEYAEFVDRFRTVVRKSKVTQASLETLALMSSLEVPLLVVRRQMASAINLIVQQARLRDGSRKIVNITEVQGMEGDVVVMQDVFLFHKLGPDEGAKVVGELRPSGVRPRCSSRLEGAGFHLPPEMFLKDVHLSSWDKRSRRG